VYRARQVICPFAGHAVPIDLSYCAASNDTYTANLTLTANLDFLLIEHNLELEGRRNWLAINLLTPIFLLSLLRIRHQ
jgi:hypothetical protein